MRFRPAGGLDLAAGALILGGAGLVAASIVAAIVLLSPPPPAGQPLEAPTTVSVTTKASAALPPDRVATVLTVEANTGAGAAARIGDHVDVLGYFARQAAGGQATTRVLVQDVPVLLVDRSGPGIALTLGVTQDAALLLQESQALGARPIITLRPIQGGVDLPSSFSETDLANRLAGTP